MIVGLAGSPANQLPLASDPTVTVGVEWLPLVAVLGMGVGIWLFLRLLAVARRLIVPLLVGAVLAFGHSGVEWASKVADLLGPVRSAGATEQSADIPPIGHFLPR